MLQALGFGLLDAEGKQVPFGAVGLESLTAITADHVLPELSECTFRIACDVTIRSAVPTAAAPFSDRRRARMLS